jgi:hypothetical protein
MAWIKEVLIDISKKITVKLLIEVIFSLSVVGFVCLKAGVVVNYYAGEVTLARYWLLISFVSGVVLCLGCFLANSFIKNRNKNRKMSYDKDEVWGLIWEWEGRRDIVDLKAFCPKCKAELKFVYRYGANNKYACLLCDFEQKITLPEHEFQELVRREIEKRKRTDEWKSAKKRMKQLKK